MSIVTRDARNFSSLAETFEFATRTHIEADPGGLPV